jgi:hypothetical protein
MKAKDLQQENEALQARVLGLAETLRASDEKIKFLENEIQVIFSRYKDLLAEVEHLRMLKTTSNKNQNDSRNY